MLKYRKAHFFVLAISTQEYKCSSKKILESFLNYSFFGKWKALSCNLIFIREQRGFLWEKNSTHFWLLLEGVSQRCKRRWCDFLFFFWWEEALTLMLKISEIWLLWCKAQWCFLLVWQTEFGIVTLSSLSHWLESL